MNKKRTMILAMLCVVLVAAATSACSRRSKAPDLARVDQEAIDAAKRPVNILDRDLRNRVAADIADATRLEDERLAVRVNLRNSTRDPLHVEVRTVFKDPTGMSISDETSWQPIFFSPQQAQTHTMVSRLPGAELATVEVRRP